MRCEALQGLETLGEDLGCQEVREGDSQLVMALMVVTFDRCLLERPVHSLHLAVGPRVVWLGRPVFDLMAPAGGVEWMTAPCRGRTFPVFGQIGELHAVIGEDDVDLVGAVDGDEEVELAFSGTDFGDVDMEVADRVGLEALPGAFVAFDLRQP